ncbi:AMP-binding protein [Micromonospora auratinigra]|uniref:Long-chain acyl-CoA synthetase n=1 Tax=Micromonospora auratinigra TaxID=261654 RepID=A0A1A8ZGB9_9ACTN|nr:AMP-binding protein [Micromonospora auratinigra]SBT42919.1 long-chain acyl-CoA synthetase [Micromonospora auratinigra]
MSTSTESAVSPAPGLDTVAELLGGPRLDHLLHRAATAAPERVALRTGEQSVSYAELDRRATAHAALLRRLLGPATDTEPRVVALSAVLDPVFPAAYYGISRAGLVSAVVNPFLREEGLAHVLRTCRAVAAVVTPAVYRRLARVRAGLPQLRVVLLTEADPELPGVPVLPELLAADADTTDGPDTAPGDPDALASVLFTSGTTGAPKAVGLTHRNLTVNAAQTAWAQSVDADAVLLNHLPTFHLMHLNIAVAAAATQVLSTTEDVVDAVREAAAVGATHFYDLPVRLIRLAGDPRLAELSLPAARGVLSGGSALPPDIGAALSRHFGVPVGQGYGLAEASPSTHFDRFDRPRPGSCGQPVPGTECRVVGLDDRAVLPAGEKGEIQIRGPQLMPGYLYQGETIEIDADGWFSTGDVGYVDADGYLWLVDRLKDVFKHDNFLVSPTEIERVLARHPGVAEGVVVDRPDAEHGAVACAIVVRRDPALTEDELTGYVADRVPYYQRLHAVTFVEAVPRSQNGKIQRRDLREFLLRRAPSDHAAADSRTAQSAARADRRPAAMILINHLKVTGDTEEFEKALKDITDFMKTKPGFQSHHLYKSLKNNQYIEMAVWDDNGGHQAALADPAFREKVGKLLQHASADPDMYRLVEEDVRVATA